MAREVKRTILLTGASGYIGRNIVEQLGEKYRFLTTRHKELELLDTSAVDGYFRNHIIDVVIHTAVVGGSRPGEHVAGALEQNLRIFFNIIRNQHRYKKLIVFGSGAEYDKSRPLRKIREGDFGKRIPQDEYGFFKFAESRYIECLENTVILRIFGIFGKYEDYALRFISNAMVKNILSLPITMYQNVYFDYVYIKDFVRIVDYFITHKAKKKFYNIGRGRKIDLITLAKKINRISDQPSKIIIKNPGLNKEYTCDNTQLMKEIKHFVFTDFDKSLLELYEYYKGIKHSFNKKEFITDKA
ncbi:hypothetical protein A3G65_03835 [Candidatus Roizmanbacteria bacterium RIFCSPLOWO2_12_FULL_37_7b]|nr:MAG: hypothetical protein A3G65_03835 [Candidatus Roizmanbacteria bacterium RIFCSPLOWO2_12_FULL_37_7b]